MKKILFITTIYIFIVGCSDGIASAEPWIDLGHVSGLSFGMNQNSVLAILGEPALLLGDSEYENTIYMYYNYHIKGYQIKGGNINLDVRDELGERSTLLKFTFVNDSLISWDEDKMTLAMAENGGSSSISGLFFQYFSVLLSLILLIRTV